MSLGVETKRSQAWPKQQVCRTFWRREADDGQEGGSVGGALTLNEPLKNSLWICGKRAKGIARRGNKSL